MTDTDYPPIEPPKEAKPKPAPKGPSASQFKKLEQRIAALEEAVNSLRGTLAKVRRRANRR